MPDATRLCLVHTIQGDLFVAPNRTKVGILPLLHTISEKDDIFVMNFGLWHGETVRPAYQQYMHLVGDFYNRTKHDFPNQFFMQTPKQHFESADGDYQVGWLAKKQGPFKCQPISGVTLLPDGSLAGDEDSVIAQYVAAGTWRNIDAHNILHETYGMPIIPVYNLTVPAWDRHRENFNGQECSHFCHPSIPQLWIYQLKLALHKNWVRYFGGDPGAKKHGPGCSTVLDREEAKLPKPKTLEEMVNGVQLERGQVQQQGQQQQRQITQQVVTVGPSSSGQLGLWVLGLAVAGAIVILAAANHGGLAYSRLPTTALPTAK